MAEYTPQELISRFEQLRNARRTWEDHWQEIADHLIPRKATITVVRTPGTKAPVARLDGLICRSPIMRN